MDTEVCSISSGEEVTPPPILRTYELAGKRVQLSEDDLRRLQPKQDLSDAVVDLAVAYILEQRLVNHQRERAYVFPAQFYGTWLATRGTIADRLRRVEQLAKPSIVMRHRMLMIPVNENKHWLLAIIWKPFQRTPGKRKPGIYFVDPAPSGRPARAGARLREYVAALTENHPLVEKLDFGDKRFPAYILKGPIQTEPHVCGWYPPLLIEKFLRLAPEAWEVTLQGLREWVQSQDIEELRVALLDYLTPADRQLAEGKVARQPSTPPSTLSASVDQTLPVTPGRNLYTGKPRRPQYLENPRERTPSPISCDLFVPPTPGRQVWVRRILLGLETTDDDTNTSDAAPATPREPEPTTPTTATPSVDTQRSEVAPGADLASPVINTRFFDQATTISQPEGDPTDEPSSVTSTPEVEQPSDSEEPTNTPVAAPCATLMPKTRSPMWSLARAINASTTSARRDDNDPMTAGPEYEPISSDELEDDPAPLDTTAIRPREDDGHETNELETPDVTMGDDSFVVLDYTHSISPANSVLSLDADEDLLAETLTTASEQPNARQRSDNMSPKTQQKKQQGTTTEANHDVATRTKTMGDRTTADNTGPSSEGRRPGKPRQRALAPFMIRYFVPGAPPAVYRDMINLLRDHTGGRKRSLRHYPEGNYRITITDTREITVTRVGPRH